MTGSEVDLSPIIVPLVQAIGGVIAALAPVLAYYLINWVRTKLKLAELGRDDEMRKVINQGLQTAIGVAINRVNAAVAGKPMTIDVKNEVLRHAAEYATTSIPQALKYFGLDNADKVRAAVESRLGILEMQSATGQQSPAVPSSTTSPTPAKS